MTKPLSVDRLGRFVLPVALRRRYGLEAGAELEVTDTGDGILLTPRRASTTLSRLSNGFPVLSSPGRTDVDLIARIEQTREERDARNRGPRPNADDA